MPQRWSNPIKLKNPLFLTLLSYVNFLDALVSHKSQVKMEGLTSTTTTETLVNLEEPSEFADISSTETTPELTSSILMQTLLYNSTTLSTDEILQDLKDTTENLEALARNETIGEQELKEWQKTSKCIQVILQW